MSALGISGETVQANIEMLRSIADHDGDIGVDNSGRIYYKEGVSSITSLFTRTHPRKEDILLETSNFLISRDLETISRSGPLTRSAFSSHINSFLDQLDKHGVLTPTLRQKILEAHYPILKSLYEEEAGISSARPDAPGSLAGEATGGGGGGDASGAASSARAAALPSSVPFVEEEEVTKKVTMILSILGDPLVPESVKDKCGVVPLGTEGGMMSGSYWVQDMDGNKLGIFKPAMEERGMDPSKRIRSDPGSDDCIGGVKNGTMWKREVAASKLCRGKLGRVPFTCALSISSKLIPGKKDNIEVIGSFQRFVEGGEGYHALLTRDGRGALDSCDPITTQGLLIRDFIMASQDRNNSNYLVKDGVIYGIDNGVCFSTFYYEIGKTVPFPLVSSVIFSKVCADPLSDEVQEEIREIDTEKELASLIEEGLIVPREALGIETRVLILKSLIDRKSPLSPQQIANIFIGRGRAAPIIDEWEAGVWESIEDKIPEEASEEDIHKLYIENFNIFLEENLTDEYIEENIRIPFS